MTETENISDFVRALRLLHSRAKDSADILKSMLDEVLRNKSSTQLAHKNDQKKPIKAIETAVIKSSLDYKKEMFDKKSNIERIRCESFEYPLERKKSRLDSSQTSRSTSSSPTPGSGLQLPVKSLPVNTITETEKTTPSVAIKLEEDSEATDIEDENTDAVEFAGLMGLACVQCKQIDIAPNNQLVECQECHNLYHQECHKPPLVDQDVSDPRFVWYCAKCQKTMKKIAVKPSKNNNKSPLQTPTSISSSTPSKDVITSTVKTPIKGEKTSSDPLLIPFKRELKVPNPSFQSTTGNSSSAKPIGLAALANISRSASVSSTVGANIKNKNGNNNSVGLSSAGGVAATSSSASLMAGADKRLQNLKKNKTKK